MKVTIQIHDDLVPLLEQQCPKSLSTSTFCAVLVEQGLDRGARLIEPSRDRQPDERGVGSISTSSNSINTNSSSIKDISITKNKAAKYVFSVPPELDAVKTELLEFWKDYKDGKKTRAAGAMLITGCQAILDKYGVSVLREQIELACANNWQGITLKGYEQYGLVTKKGFTPAEPQHKHPAYRDASDVLAESERIAQQNLEHLRRKQEESQATGGVLDGLF